MALITIPNPKTKLFTQPNSGDLFGNLWATFNVDLRSSIGKLKISPRVFQIINNGDNIGGNDTDLGLPVAIVKQTAGTPKWWAICGGVMFKSSDTTPVTWTQDATTDTPTGLDPNYTDMVYWEGNLVVSTSQDLWLEIAGGWTKNWWVTTLAQSGGLYANKAHPLGVFQRLLIIGDGHRIHTVDRNSIVNNARLTLEGTLTINDFHISTIASGKSRVWFGTRPGLYNADTTKDYCWIGEWDGYSQTFNQLYKVKGNAILAMIVKDEIPYAVNNLGQLLAFDGNDFIEVARFPVWTEELYQDNVSTIEEAEWRDTAVALPSFFRQIHKNGIAVIDGDIHFLINGAINSTHSKLLDNMLSGIWVYNKDIGLYHKYSLANFKSGETVIDYGISVLSKVGALVPAPRNQGGFLCGAEIYTSATVKKTAIFSKDINDDTSKRGYFITPKIEASEIENFWDKIWVRLEKLRSSSDEIVIKKMTDNLIDYNLPFRATITWSTTTKFTSTDANFAYAAIGNEVEIRAGVGAGTTAHITVISEAAGTYTITIDETITGATGTAIVRVNGWKKVGIFNEITRFYKDFGLNDISSWIKFKVELREKLVLNDLKVVSHSNLDME